MIRGQCLCGAVKFVISGAIPNLYQCHCSECRRCTGSSANAATFVSAESFVWLEGKEQISSFKKDSGYRNDFCSNCGSTVPNPMQDASMVWIPAGLLDETVDIKVIAHLYMNSKAAWEASAKQAVEYAESPGLEALQCVLQRTS